MLSGVLLPPESRRHLHRLDRNSMKRIMSGYIKEPRSLKDFYVHPDSNIYLALRYFRGIGIIANFVIFPML